MKFNKKTAVFLLVVLAACHLSVAAAAVTELYGAAAVEEGGSYTLEQMLTYAIEDEYLAKARYTADVEKFGSLRPFVRIAEAEMRHIDLLKPLFAKYNVTVPQDKAAQYVAVPDSLLDAMKQAVTGEKNNMRMYELFLKQDLPDDVRITFSLLKTAAENHLHAFQRNVVMLERMLRS